MNGEGSSRHGGGIGDRTFALLFGAAYLTLLVGLIGVFDLRQATVVAVIGGVYVAIGTRGFAWVERGGRLGWAIA